MKRARLDAEEELQRFEREGASSILTADQLIRYRELKEVAKQRAGTVGEDLAARNDELANEERSLQSERREMNQKRSAVVQKRKEQDGYTDKAERLKRYLQRAGEDKDAKENEYAEAEKKISSVDDDLMRCQAELETVNGKIGELRVDQNESSWRDRKKEVIEKLRAVIGEEHVYGRLMDLTNPTHRKYELAITKILARHMNSIVVTSDDIAADCIKVLKEQELETEYFLPVDALKEREIDERFRHLSSSCKLVYDVLDIVHGDVRGMKKVLKFACTNALVCEAKDKARDFAYPKDAPRRQVVTLEGTLFDKSGSISGGASSLRSKAKGWSTKEADSLKKRQIKLEAEHRTLLHQKRESDDAKKLRVKLDEIEGKIKSTEKDRRDAERKAKEVESKLDLLQGTLSVLESRVEQKTIDVDKLKERVKEIRKELESVDSAVFAEFCKDVGVASVSDLEEQNQEERSQQESKLAQLRNQEGKLTKQIEFSASRVITIEKAIATNSRSVEAGVKTLAEVEEVAQGLSDDIERIEEALEEAKAIDKKHSEDRDAQQKTLDEKKKETAAAQKRLSTIRRNIASEELHFDEKRDQRYNELQVSGRLIILVATCR